MSARVLDGSIVLDASSVVTLVDSLLYSHKATLSFVAVMV